MIYLISKPGRKVAYYNFDRLLQDERIVEMCHKSGDLVPTKEKLPVLIIYNQILIEYIDFK